MSKLSFTAWTLVVDKNALTEPYSAMPKNSLYAYFLSEAIRLIPEEKRVNSTLILDEFDRSGKTLLELRRVLKRRGIVHGFKKIVAKRSTGESLIQIADLIAGAVFQKFER